MPREGRATEPWELREVLLDRNEMESPPTGVRDPSPEWRFITEDSWGRGGEEGEGEERREKGRRGGRRKGEEGEGKQRNKEGGGRE